MKQYLKNILIGIDQLVNTIFGGDPDETISARSYRMEYKGSTFWKFMRLLIDALALIFLDFNHCQKSHESEVVRNQLPEDYQI